MNSNTEQQTARRFAKLMVNGKVRSAMRLHSDEEKGTPLPLDNQLATDDLQPPITVRDELLKKHPPGQPAHPDTLLYATTSLETHPVIFHCLNGAAIHSAALHINGTAGPSCIDATGWRQLCTSFQTTSADLCNSLALVAKKLCTSYVDSEGLAPLTASRLIALDKCPGVRPIGVGETSRRIISKAILSVIKLDVLEAAGTLQLCAGQEAGSKAVVHAMRHIFEDAESEAVLLVDASNAFHSMNRKAALHNIHHLCPPLAVILTNTYRRPVVHRWRNTPLGVSCEETTQGDPLAMAMNSHVYRTLFRYRKK